jgi:holo-[acyl-carrier protein] synthase
MIIGIGTDILKVERIEQALQRSAELSHRILTSNEQEMFNKSTQPGRFLAKRFAAKEAVVKALGTGIGNGVGWKHIEISKDPLGKPLITLFDGALSQANELGVNNCFLSYSDEREFIVAMVVMES